MAQADILKPGKSPSSSEPHQCKAAAAGLFGYSIRDGRMQRFIPMPGYVRDLEQLPNFSPPSIERFLAQYVQSNIGVTKSSS